MALNIPTSTLVRQASYHFAGALKPVDPARNDRFKRPVKHHGPVAQRLELALDIGLYERKRFLERRLDMMDGIIPLRNVDREACVSDIR
jgi:hypothetical protein